MKPLRIATSLLLAAALAAGEALVACDTETATTCLVENGYPAVPPEGPSANQTIVYRAWWVATYYAEPVPGGASSTEERAVPAIDFAYALLAPGWDPASAAPPSKLIVVKSKAPLGIARGETLRIVVSDQSFAGSCAAQQPLVQAEIDFITQSIFPGEFAGATYDARTCTTILAAPNGGASAESDGGAASEAGPGDGSASDGGDAG
jgi:hypothetical protein